MTKRIRTLLVDDYRIFRDALGQLLTHSRDFSLVRATEDLREAELALRGTDVALVNGNLHDESVLPIVRRWRQQFPSVRILVLGEAVKSATARKVIEAGAIGFVSRHDELKELFQAIRMAAQGATYLSSKTRRTLATPASADSMQGLTRREGEVLREIATGNPVRKIADRLGISVKTVERHRENIKIKWHLESSTEVLREAMRYFPEAIASK